MIRLIINQALDQSSDYHWFYHRVNALRGYFHPLMFLCPNVLMSLWFTSYTSILYRLLYNLDRSNTYRAIQSLPLQSMVMFS